jgi:hypothetical protein
MGEDVHVVAIAVSSDPDKVKKMVELEGLKYPIYFSPAALSSQYRVASLPTTYVVNSAGKIVASSVGYSPGWDFKRMLASADD